MTREETIEELSILLNKYQDGHFGDAIDIAMTALEQEPFINKPCVSNGICEHDKQNVLDKIRAEIENTEIVGHIRDVECFNAGINVALNVINKYKEESEEQA